MLADMPLVTTELLTLLKQEFIATKMDKIVYPDYFGRQGNPVIFPRKYFDDLAALDGDRVGKILLKKYANECRAVAVDTDSVLKDIDTMKDYDSIRAIIEDNDA